MADDVGSLLLRSGIVAAEQLDLARSAVTEHGGTLSEQLVRGGFIDDEELTSFYGTRLLIPRINPSELAKVKSSVLDRLPADMATEFRSIPIAIDVEGNLTLLMSDPSDTKAADEIGFFTGNYVMRAIATQAQIAWCLAHYYKQRTDLYLDLVAAGEWPDNDLPAASVKSSHDFSTATFSTDKDTTPMGVPVFADEAEAKGGHERSRTEREPEAQPVRVTLDAETGPLKAALSRPHNQQASPPELFARAGEITSSIQLERTVDPSPAVVISLEDEENPILMDRQRGTDTAPILLSDIKLRLEAEEAAQVGDAIQTILDETSGPIVLDQSQRKGRRLRRTDLGVGVGGDKRQGSDSTEPPDFLGAAPPSFDDAPEGVPLAIDEDLTYEIRALGATPAPLNTDNAAPHSELGSERHGTMAQASSRLLLALRAIDQASSKDEVIEPMLDFLDGAFERTGFMALRQDDLIAWQLHGCADSASGGVHMSIDEASSFTSVVRMRLPYNGPIEDAPTKKLARDIDIPDALDLLALPLMIRERVIGVLFGMGSHGTIFEEHLAVLSQAASEAFEELLRKRRS